MGQDDYLPEHERRLLRRQRRKTVRASATTLEMSAPAIAEAQRAERISGEVPSFRAQALALFASEVDLVADLEQLLQQVLSGARDQQLADALGTDSDGLRDLERRFKERVGRSVYVSAVEVVNRAARLRFETLG
jgi:hypothetical protein